MTGICVLGAVSTRAEVITALEDAGLEVVGEGRTLADGVRLAARCAAMVVLDDPPLVTALADQVRVPLIALMTDAHLDPPDGAALLSPWPTTHEGLSTLVEQVEVVATRAIPLMIRSQRRGPGASERPADPSTTQPARRDGAGPTPVTRPKILVIGASAGGPPALVTLLRQLRPLPAPIVIIQHQHPAFADSLRTWLGRAANVPVSLAVEGMALGPRMVVLGRPGQDLVIGTDRRCHLQQSRPGAASSVDMCMRSVARAHGAAALGIILTGMGEDGAEGLRAMRDRGAITVAQDRASSAVFGMPAAAVRLGAAEQVLPLTDMAEAIHDAFLAGATT